MNTDMSDAPMPRVVSHIKRSQANVAIHIERSLRRITLDFAGLPLGKFDPIVRALDSHSDPSTCVSFRRVRIRLVEEFCRNHLGVDDSKRRIDKISQKATRIHLIWAADSDSSVIVKDIEERLRSLNVSCFIY